MSPLSSRNCVPLSIGAYTFDFTSVVTHACLSHLPSLVILPSQHAFSHTYTISAVIHTHLHAIASQVTCAKVLCICHPDLSLCSSSPVTLKLPCHASYTCCIANSCLFVLDSPSPPASHLLLHLPPSLPVSCLSVYSHVLRPTLPAYLPFPFRLYTCFASFSFAVSATLLLMSFKGISVWELFRRPYPE